MSMTPDCAYRNALKQRIFHFIDNASPHQQSQKQEDEFNRLALEVFSWQYSANKPYQRLCDRRSSPPASIQHWSQIPAVTTASFKTIPLFCFETDKACAVFHTSGTTESTSGKHYFHELGLYESAALKWFQLCCVEKNNKVPYLVLGPTAKHFPNSSLGQMFSWIIEAFGTDENLVAFSRGESILSVLSIF